MHHSLRYVLPTKPGGILLLIGLCAVAAWWHAGTRRDPLADLEIEGLVARLNARGMQVRAVPAMRNGPLHQGAYLTISGKTFDQLNRLQVVPERIDEWQGTVYCYRLHSPQTHDARLAMWGDCGQQTGPFVLFGDRALRERISEALGAVPAAPPDATMPRHTPSAAAD